jgi:hypothetical protein
MDTLFSSLGLESHGYATPHPWLAVAAVVASPWGLMVLLSIYRALFDRN